MIGENKMKKIYSLLLVLCLIFSLSACGSNGTATDNDTGSFCTECDEEISATDKFCGSCGASVGKSTTDNSTTNTTQNNDSSNSDSIDVPSSTTSKATTTTKPETSKPTTTTKPNTTTHTHSYSDATCTTPAKCSCGATNGNALGHNYKKGFCVLCNEKIGDEYLSYISITKDNWEEFFEITRKDIIPEKNAFGEYGTPEDMHYTLEMELRKEYVEKLVSIDVSIEVVRDTYLQSYDYDKTTGIGTITNKYKKPYNNTDTSLCNFKDNTSAYVCACHVANNTIIDGEVIYYAYICESINCLRAAGTIVLQRK